MSISQLNKLKSGIKNCTDVFLKLSANVVGDSNDENNFPHKFLLTNTKVSNFHKAFVNNPSANIKLSKTQLHKMGQSRGFLGRFLGPLLKTGLPLMKNVVKSLAKSVLIPLGFTASASATDAAIHKEMFGSGRPRMLASRPSDLAPHTTTLIISNEEKNYIMKRIKSLEGCGLLIKGVSKQIKMKKENNKEDFPVCY